MAIKRRKIDTSLERQILTGMVVSDRYLKEIQAIYHPDLLEVKQGTTIARWCFRHFATYQKAPGILIQDIFSTWAKGSKDEELVKYIEEFLNALSDEYVHGNKFNADYLLDKTVGYFKKRSLKLLAEDITECLAEDDVDGAETLYADYRKVEKITSVGVDVLDDEDAWQRAFEDQAEPLFTVPGKLGHLLNTEMIRGGFVSLMGVAKIGKTWNLTFLTQCALRARCNVAMFQVGDMSESAMMVRNGIYITQRSNKAKYCGEILIPIMDCKHNQKDTCPTPKKRTSKFGIIDTEGELLDFDSAVGYEACTACKEEKKSPFMGAVWYTKRRPVRPLTWQEAYKAAQEYKKRIRAKQYKLATYPNRSMSVSGIESVLDTWERVDGFIPDVIVIDYADILAPEKGSSSKEFRHSSNETWMALRSLCQQRHILLITATQASGAAIKQQAVTREHYSEDRRKYDHVTAMFSLSQTAEEKRKGITRWGAIVIREDDWDEEYHVNVIGCLQVGRPYLDSF